MSSTDSALPAGYILNEYRLESVLGAGGFGVTYLATDCNLDLKVALKEYLPIEFAARGADQSVTARSNADANSFDWGLRRFLDEARALASFRHPNIVRVMRFFEGNNTGYMVMEFVEGESLDNWINGRRPLPQQDLLDITGALLDGLSVMHKAGYLHRDIKPANIFIRADGSPVLIDFGSARSVQAGRGLTAMMSPGYAPLEQYHAHGNQGPWSDLYALGGVMYWLVTGAKPVEAAARVRNDIMTPASASLSQGVYSANVLHAIDWALRPDEDQRPQSTEAFMGRLGIATENHEWRRSQTKGAAPHAFDQPPTRTIASGGHPLTATSHFDPDLIHRMETDVARILGPIAAVIVRKAARKSTTLAALCQTVAKEIEDEHARAAFIRKFAHDGRTSPRTHPPTQPRHTLAPQSVSSKFAPDVLQRAEAELARHIGTIAGVVVRHAAAKARDESELYLLIADEIEDPAEKKNFVRKAVTASRRLK